MTKHTETVGNYTITIEDDESLNIAGKAIDYAYDPVSNKWSSRYLPYSSYDSLLELARAIATDTVEFIDSHN
jgi:hypothetical protein